MKTKFIAAFGFFAVALTGLAEMIQTGNVGISIGTRQSDNGPLRVAEVFAGSPADAVGIKTNWFLISVDGTNVVSMSSRQCMGLVHGSVGTAVTLELADPTLSRTNTFTVKRADVKVPEEIFRDFFNSGPGKTNAPVKPPLIAR